MWGEVSALSKHLYPIKQKAYKYVDNIVICKHCSLYELVKNEMRFKVLFLYINNIK